MTFIVYVLKSAGGRQFTGHTESLVQQLDEHNAGRCEATKTDRDWRVVYTEQFPTRNDAARREKWLKSGAGRRYIKDTVNR